VRWSQLFVPTLRQSPVDAESASHRLLVRAGYVRRLASGHYTLLPLAVRVRSRIAAVVRDEMDGIGAQELLFPAMHPAELWQRSGRWTSMGDEMFRLRDRRGADLALGMTHEEAFADLARELASYRELPQLWYQIQTKFRDEPRPKAGLLRTREFTMKDSYSFDLDEAGLDASFERHRLAYERIFTRLGLPFRAVEASSGAMGGSDSVEFMTPTDAGEDDIVTCAACGYAANVERATSKLPPPAEGPPSSPVERFATPGVRTIRDLEAEPYGVAAALQVKTLVYLVDGTPTLALLRGDHDLVDQKLADGTGATDLRPADADEIRAALGASPGSLGAVGVEGLPVLADPALRGARDMTTGANDDDVHLRHVDVDRDIAVTRWVELRAVQEGDPCPRCDRPLHVETAVEIGHIFKLGRRYGEAFGARVLDAEGTERTLVMGSYGIGLERALATIVETHHDDRGIVWPVSVAPFDVVLVPLARSDETSAAVARLRGELAAGGLSVLVDDRDERPGVKLKDVELIGVPHRLVIGPRSLAEGQVELGVRATGEVTPVPVDEAAELTITTIERARHQLLASS
jgi:prolyl-tRNA synthetase